MKKSRSGRTYTDAEAGQALGVHPATVRRWRRQGRIVERPDGSLDAAATLKKAEQTRDPTLGGRPDRLIGGDGLASSTSDRERLVRARVLRETLAAKALRLEIEEREGRLVDRAQAERIYVSAITDLRSRIESVPERVSTRLVGLDERAIQHILREEIDAALQEASEVPYIGTEANGDHG